MFTGLGDRAGKIILNLHRVVPATQEEIQVVELHLILYVPTRLLEIFIVERNRVARLQTRLRLIDRVEQIDGVGKHEAEVRQVVDLAVIDARDHLVLHRAGCEVDVEPIVGCQTVDVLGIAEIVLLHGAIVARHRGIRDVGQATATINLGRRALVIFTPLQIRVKADRIRKAV